MSWVADKRWGIAVLAVAIVGALLLTQPRWALRAIGPAICPSAALYVETATPVVALTLDDGPSADPAVTAAILAVLRAHQARATFFAIGSHLQPDCEACRAVLEQTLADGHEIGNHLSQDRPAVALGPVAFTADLAATEKVLARSHRSQWLRPGSGFCSRIQSEIASERGYHLALGSIWPYDTLPLPPWFAARFVLASLKPGAIVVLHERGPNDDQRGRRTIQTLAALLPRLQQRGYRVVSLSELAESGKLVPAAKSAWPIWADRLRGRATFGFVIRKLTSGQQQALLGTFILTNGTIIVLGFASGLLRWQWLLAQLPLGAALAVSLRLLVFPAIFEEWLYRGLLLPAAAELDGTIDLRQGLVAIPGLLLFVLSHIPAAAIADRALAKPSGFRATFWRWDFLACATLLGLACTASYLYCGSLYPAIAEHWVVVWVWFFCLNGYQHLYPKY